MRGYVLDLLGKHEQCYRPRPPTTTNLACGFDTLGCALSLYNTLSFTLSDRLSFTGCDEEFQTPDNLACQGFDARVCPPWPPGFPPCISTSVPISPSAVVSVSSAAMLSPPVQWRQTRSPVRSFQRPSFYR